jgi:hypothetical protein
VNLIAADFVGMYPRPELKKTQLIFTVTRMITDMPGYSVMYRRYESLYDLHLAVSRPPRGVLGITSEHLAR